MASSQKNATSANQATPASQPVFSFGSASGSTSTAVPFSFASSPRIEKQDEAGAADEDDVVHEPQIDTKSLMVGAGEEDEDTLFTQPVVKIYEFANGDYNEVGKGELRIKLHRITKKSRILVRAQDSGRVLFNSLLDPNIILEKVFYCLI